MELESGDVAPAELIGGMADAADCSHEVIYRTVARNTARNYGDFVRGAWIVWLNIYWPIGLRFSWRRLLLFRFVSGCWRLWLFFFRRARNLGCRSGCRWSWLRLFDRIFLSRGWRDWSLSAREEEREDSLVRGQEWSLNSAWPLIVSLNFRQILNTISDSFNIFVIGKLVRVEFLNIVRVLS